MKKILIVICILLLCACEANQEIKEEEETVTEESISELYPEITGESVIDFATQEQILNMIQNGTGIVFLSWNDCPWCHGYINLLNECARTSGLNVLYYDIYEDRNNDTDFYKAVVNEVKDYVDSYAYYTNGEKKVAYDSSGNPRIYVPMVVMISKGEIIALDYEGSMESDYDLNHEAFWSEEIATGISRYDNLQNFFLDVFASIKEVKDEIDEEGCDGDCKLS